MHPNVCVIVIDALRAKNLPTYGHERRTAPVIDSVADDGVVYNRATAPAPVTIDSVASLFTGRYPTQHRAGDVARLETDVETLPEFFKRHGYTTTAATCNPFVTPWGGFGAGIDHFRTTTHPFSDGINVRDFFTEHKELSKPRRYLRFFRNIAGRNFAASLGNALQFKFGLFEGDDDGGAKATDAALSEMTPEDAPWFSYIHYTETHMNATGTWPYSVPEGRFRFFDEQPSPDEFGHRTAEVDYDDRTANRHEQLYDAAVRYVDGLVGQVIDHLTSTGQYDETMLIITADHGELLGEHGLLGHGYLYEPGVRVPLVIDPPADTARPDERVSSRVNIIGLYRTVASLVASDWDEGVRGTNLLTDPSEEWTLSQNYSSDWKWSRYESDEDESAGRHAFYRDELKLHVRPSPALYDLREDPDEMTDRSQREPDQYETLRESFESRLSELRPVDRADEAAEFDSRSRQRLRELGYLE